MLDDAGRQNQLEMQKAGEESIPATMKETIRANQLPAGKHNSEILDISTCDLLNNFLTGTKEGDGTSSVKSLYAPTDVIKGAF